MKLNGERVERLNTTIFIRLPPEAWEQTDGCACDVCKEDHGIPLAERKMAPVAFWDTLAVSTNPEHRYTWMVHHPSLYSAAARKAERDRRAATLEKAA